MTAERARENSEDDSRSRGLSVDSSSVESLPKLGRFEPSTIHPDFTRLDATKLAACLGVSTWVVKGMKIAAAQHGDSPFMGRYTTLRRASAWFDRHPEFVASHHLRKCPARHGCSPVRVSRS